ncbi:MAG: ABC transporter substrate-binding protein [Candidatus Thorarchaeota archaeon]
MSRRIFALLMISALLFPLTSSLVAVAQEDIPHSLRVGPYIDSLVYKVISNQDQRMLALESGDIDLDSSFFDPVHQSIFDSNPDLDYFSTVRNGYGHYTINCRDYPLNISGLRRAIAYALDKEAHMQLVMDGYSQLHDSLVPYPMDWCVEDQLEWHYYTAQPWIGNAILDDLGFTIDPGTGFRLAPDASPFNITMEYVPACELPGATAEIMVWACESLHINVQRRAVEYADMFDRLNNHGHYDIVFYGAIFEGNDARFLADEYWSENVDVYQKNPTNFVNATYDYWRDQFLHGTTYGEVYEAAAEMQRILHFNVPRIVIYENIYNSGYRIDKFTGHVGDLTKGISGPWTTRNIRRLSGSFGGTVDIAIGQEPDSFNIFVTHSDYSNIVLENLYSSLYDYGPGNEPVPDLAKSILFETHADDSSIPEGHSRFIFDIIRNATWSNGVPLTAEDVAFTYNYMLDANATILLPLSDLYGVWSPTPYRVIFEFSSESYWHFYDIAFTKIIPRHIFNDVTGIGHEAWKTWNPVFDPVEPHVTSGPFTFEDYNAGEFYTLSYNPDFYFAPNRSPEPTTSTTTTTQPTSPEPDDLMDVFLAATFGASIAVIVIVLGEVIRRYRRPK